jgi:hypothetical protein
MCSMMKPVLLVVALATIFSLQGNPGDSPLTSRTRQEPREE